MVFGAGSKRATSRKKAEGSSAAEGEGSVYERGAPRNLQRKAPRADILTRQPVMRRSVRTVYRYFTVLHTYGIKLRSANAVNNRKRTGL